ncbi:MAG: hypothetical protein LBT99_01175 [Bifidobacteriaceae bacterium]|jgi:hypothetical protein|nr:hypothetical protein [Bifidobacteriaceae bacterium]
MAKTKAMARVKVGQKDSIKRLIVCVLVAVITLSFVVLTIAGCSSLDSEAKTGASYDQNTGNMSWKVNNQLFYFVLDKNFVYDSDKSDQIKNQSKDEFNTNVIFANAIFDNKATVTFSATYQDDNNRPLTKVYELKKQTDMHQIFGLGLSQKILISSVFSGDNILYGAWAKVQPLSKNNQVYNVNIYVLTAKGHITFAFQTANAYNFTEDFIHKFVQSIKVEV